ncbi:hypothetical protein [uncultured Pontibacter sp.]|uniref:hypothetical protein n=1 Tax=uncultured Pontibacter sp. TaxID=453356 RepID=UPI0026291B5C|nr:hypothetical protein [uncultured Pontibacter sp.]
MDAELLFEKVYINSELADQVCAEFKIKRGELTDFTKKYGLERADEIKKIQRIRGLFHSKKGSPSFGFTSFNSFYKWYIAQHKKQDGACYYCKTDEHVIATLVEKKFNQSKRIRGRYLEIERRDSAVNTYSPENCVLACYFCNNDKSDIFEEGDYLAYLKDRKAFFDTKFEEFNDIK